MFELSKNTENQCNVRQTTKHKICIDDFETHLWKEQRKIKFLCINMQVAVGFTIGIKLHFVSSVKLL